MADPSSPSAGAVLLQKQTRGAPRDEMMFVFQQYNKSIFPWKSVLDNVMLALKYRSSAGRQELEALCLKQLETVGLARYAHYYPYQLSGGMQQRVAIARALVRRPQ